MARIFRDGFVRRDRLERTPQFGFGVEAVEAELRNTVVSVVVAEDPRLLGFSGTVIGTTMPGDELKEDALEAWLKTLALARCGAHRQDQRASW